MGGLARCAWSIRRKTLRMIDKRAFLEYSTSSAWRRVTVSKRCLDKRFLQAVRRNPAPPVLSLEGSMNKRAISRVAAVAFLPAFLPWVGFLHRAWRLRHLPAHLGFNAPYSCGERAVFYVAGASAGVLMLVAFCDFLKGGFRKKVIPPS